MRNLFLSLTMSIALFCGPVYAQIDNATVYIVHGIQGRDLELDADLPVDIAAILAADPSILDTLSGEGEFTVFGPTDEAFAAIDITTSNVGDLDQAFLTDVLLYHVSLGRLLATDVLAYEQIEMLKGGFLTQND